MANILPDTENFSASTWFVDGATRTANTYAPPKFAGSYAALATTVSDNDAALQGELYCGTKVISTAAQDWTGTLYVRKSGLSIIQFGLEFRNGSPQVALSVRFDPSGAGAIADLSGAAPAASGFLDIDDLWWRLWIRHANVPANNNNEIRINFFPAIAPTLSAGAASSQTGDQVIWGANITQSSSPMSYESDPVYASNVIPALYNQFPKSVLIR